jgi:hypothetical protein
LLQLSRQQGMATTAHPSAYCASPMSGQGTSIALISAYVLAGEAAAASGAHLHAFPENGRNSPRFAEDWLASIDNRIAINSQK